MGQKPESAHHRAMAGQGETEQGWRQREKEKGGEHVHVHSHAHVCPIKGHLLLIPFAGAEIQWDSGCAAGAGGMGMI